MIFTAAIIGRPNVGKSTLFNRLVGQRLALVDDLPGVTRDRREGKARLGDLEFNVVDTAGLEEAGDSILASRMREQTEAAIAEADVVLMVIDARSGITPLDRHFAEELRRHRAPVILIANKSEGKAGFAGAYEAFELGLGDPVPISAEHGEGMGELFDVLLPYSVGDGSEEEPRDPEKPMMLAIVGRPNVGKSTLINRLIGQNRLLTGPEAGITRDAISVDWHWRDRKVRLVDTAGLRRKSSIDEKLEQLSVSDTLRAIRFAEMVVLVLDATVMLEKQDLTIARMVEDEGRAMIVVANKWDLVENKPQALEKLSDRISTSLPQLAGLVTVPVSAAGGAGLDKMMDAAFAADAVWNTRVGTPKLNRWLADVQERHPPPLVDGKRLRLRYITQANTRPPTFALFSSKPGGLPDLYRRYLINLLRHQFDLPGVPIRMMLRKGNNPFADRD